MGPIRDNFDTQRKGKRVPLQEDFVSSGNWLFRWRGYLPITLITFFLFIMCVYKCPNHTGDLSTYWEILCLLISSLGLAMRFLTIGYTPRDTSGRNTEKQDAGSLNTTGLYSLVRNPLYLGNFFMYLGIALFTAIWWLTFIFVLVFWLYYERIIFAEESFLRAEFGQQYLDWAAKTPAIFPRFSGFKKSPLPFSLRNVLKREFNGFFAVILVMFIFETMRKFSATGRLEFDTEWIILMSIGVLVWLTLRTLKKYTTVLHVEGR